MDKFKRIAMWTGIVLIGVCGVILLGGGKIVSGTLLVTTAFLMALPSGPRKLPLWIGIPVLCGVFALVAWNISTTELPDTSHGMVMCGDEISDLYSPTGIEFVDQVMYIFSGFLAQAAPS
ncbi:hypothetical protein [Glycomyces algeriensis]|uniref:Uncharacterized protein n=1 Tax=Glycomyces algeriensis TaxID=256037 RepID=A0A9W6G643_9ACTN|nr:hypothetical protein [Glycomyces algeriensis]MDA1367201.1 hypothetical protein [Glycomyces algeriensis]MDR7353415.1 hypothetical protein [Glycomyces algeriensis]GLI41111.1 hypothetical protein GALLR39Z86_09610 [Glycomyces algeriensis]